MRELIGEDGHSVAAFMFDLMTDDRQKTGDRIEAARWLPGRGFGKAAAAPESAGTSTPEVPSVANADATERLEELLRVAREVGWHGGEH